MSKRKHRKQSTGKLVARPMARRTALIVVTVVLAVGIAAAALLRGGDPGFGALKGRWLRPDGGYILEIRDVGAGGTMDAAYLNPRPINVARAEATRDGSTLRVFVELRAPNYPGSTYTLAYDREYDQLRGIYFQAALQRSFDVIFVRMK